MRSVLIHRADVITGPYEGRLALQDKGVAQGGLVNTPNGRWFAYLFRDFGSVGRVPYMVPVNWEDGWPVLGINHQAPDTLALPANKSLMSGIISSDEFNRKGGERDLPLVWQWNHNPVNQLWSVRLRKGYLRLTTGRIDTTLVAARNILTQRTFGPGCSAITALDVSGLKDGDCAGLALLQQKFGWVGVKVENGNKYIVMVNAQGILPTASASIPLTQNRVYLKAACDFKDRTDKAYFYYSIDGNDWIPIGVTLQMAYTIPHFMGYRFGLFNYATKATGGYADFDYFRIGGNKIATQH
jgi:beta-xylosidase